MAKDNRNTLTPKLRFPQFRNHPMWDTKLGGELFDQTNNRGASAGLPVLAITQEHGAIPRDEIDYHVSVTDKSIETYKEVLPGDFIISLRSFQGGIEYSKYHGICSPAYVVLRKKAEISDAFYKYLFKSHGFIQQLTKNLEGIRDGKMISYKQFSELRLPCPSSSEQQKIAECLSTLDELIEAESRKLDTLKDHKKGLMQQLFPREGETRPRLRFPEFHSDPEWREATLGEAVDFESGGTPSRQNSDLWNGAIPWVTAKDMKQLFLDDTEDHITEAAIKNGARVAPAGTVLMLTRGMTLFKDVPICVLRRPMSFNQDVKALRTKGDLTTDFLPHLLIAYKQRLLDLVSPAGHGTGRINTDDIGSLNVRYPKAGEQKYLSACFTSLELLIVAQSEKLEALRVHKRGLMQQLFPSTSAIEP